MNKNCDNMEIYFELKHQVLKHLCVCSPIKLFIYIVLFQFHNYCRYIRLICFNVCDFYHSRCLIIYIRTLIDIFIKKLKFFL